MKHITFDTIGLFFSDELLSDIEFFNSLTKICKFDNIDLTKGTVVYVYPDTCELQKYGLYNQLSIAHKLRALGDSNYNLCHTLTVHKHDESDLIDYLAGHKSVAMFFTKTDELPDSMKESLDILRTKCVPVIHVHDIKDIHEPWVGEKLPYEYKQLINIFNE